MQRKKDCVRKLEIVSKRKKVKTKIRELDLLIIPKNSVYHAYALVDYFFTFVLAVTSILKQGYGCTCVLATMCEKYKILKKK